MGMAASQSRFLALTARKSNTEYQGQQVNQQRTTLSNESSNLYNQMLTLNPPTPPSTNNYYDLTYTLENSNTGVKYSFVDYSLVGTDMHVVLAHTDNKEILGSAGQRRLTSVVTTNSSTGVSTVSGLKYKDSNGVEQLVTNFETYSCSDDGHIQNTSLEDYIKNAKLDWLDKKYDVYSFEIGDQVYYVPSNQISKEDGKESYPTLMQARTGNVTTTTKVPVERFHFENGRILKVELKDSSELTGIGLSAGEYKLNVSKTDNEDAYQDAMNKYEYEKALYDKKIEEINAKTKIIQSKDKNLELKLKQLDTEQNAIQTEMEAVQKVIEKNVEDTFKTFA